MPLSQLLESSDRESKAELQLILNAVVEGFCALDAGGNITFCNDALLRMTGYRTEEIIGNNLHELLHHSRSDGRICHSEPPPSELMQELESWILSSDWRDQCVESSIYSFAPTVPRTSRTANGNRFRVGSRTTFGAESWYFFPRVLSSQPPAASTFFTHSDWLL